MAYEQLLARKDVGGMETSPPRMRDWVSLAILLLFFILSTVDRSVIGLMVDLIKADLQISDFQVGLLQGLAFALFYGMASIPMAWIADRTSRHKVIYIGVTFWSMATALCGMAGSFWQLFLARLGVGAGEATLSPAAYALVSEIFPPRRIALAVGILAGGMAIGAGLALAIGGAAVQWATALGPVAGLRPWQMTFLLVGLPGLVLAPLVFLIPRPNIVAPIQSGAQGDMPSGFGAWLVGNATYLVPFFLGLGLQAVLSYGMMAWTPTFLAREFGLQPLAAGSTLGLMISVGGFIGFIGGGWLTDYLHSAGVRDAHLRYCLVNCVLLSAIGVIAFAFSVSAWMTLALILPINMLAPMTGPAVAQLQLATPSHFRARAIAVMTVFYTTLGMVVGPVAVPLLAEGLGGSDDNIGNGLALLIGTAGLLGALCFYLALGPSRRAVAAKNAAATVVAG